MAAPPARYAGTRVPRVEDTRLLTGHGTFVDDVTRLFRSGRKDEAATVIPDELVDDAAIVGNTDYVREQIAAWQASGVTMMVVGAKTVEQINDLAALM